MLLCHKSYLCKILSMLYDSNGLKPYIHIYIYIYIYIYIVFQNLSMCHTYIYSVVPTPIHWISNFQAVSEVSGTAETVFTGHVRPMAQTYPASRTCLAPRSDMFGSRVPSLYKGAERPPPPLNPRPPFLFHSISYGGQWLSRRFWVFSIESLRFLGDLTPLLLRTFKH
jgi:hypothetical protein